jgi:hypothetical protein
MIAPKPHSPRKREVKRVTIAAGILCADGIVMCADSQEINGDFKWHVKKLVYPRATIGDFSIMISGAGFGPAIDTAAQKIFSRTAMNAPSYDQTVRIIEDVLREIHEKDLRYYPTNDKYSLQFRLLIAFTSGGAAGLFVSDGSLLTRVDSFEVIGSGEITKFFAYMLYKQTALGYPTMNTAEGAVFATFLVYLAKSQLTSVGGKPQLAIIRYGAEGGICFANVWEAPAIEPIFPGCLEIGAQILLKCANPHLPERAFNDILREHGKSLKRLHRSITKQKKYWDALWREYKNAGIDLVGHTPTQSDSETSEDQP